ncbi:hypothetical protein H0H93_006394 [Arthromyces matolae]|nr:hypothetical protein H0H93_006394 [Arthromyces matolae]
MSSASSAPSTASTVIFPVSEQSPRHVASIPQPRTAHLPFRRISLPTAPSKLHRDSVISVASFESMPEDRNPQNINLAVPRNPNLVRNNKIDSPRRRSFRPSRPSNDPMSLKRRKVIEEFYETEKAYVDGLELIYSHFLTPIIASLDSPNPLLERSSLTSIFSNFIDIWNLHRSFFTSLTTQLAAPGVSHSTSGNHDHLEPLPALGPTLLSHFPYLSLYNPFITSFPETISTIGDLITPPSSTRPNPKYSAAFATFLSEQESDPRCGKLKLRDWLLTIVQRCPRYLLLLKDLISSTEENDPEHAKLLQVQALVSKITLSLNTSLHTHAQTLALLSLQRATPNLPFQLIVPGRALLKRGPLLQVERSEAPREREFLLFSDCLVWLAGEDVERAQWIPDWGISRSGWASGHPEPSTSPSETSTSEPSTSWLMQRSRSKSEAELSSLEVGDVNRERSDSQQRDPSPSTPTRITANNRPRRSYHPPSSMISRRNGSDNGNEKWTYKGRAELVDLEVVVPQNREEGEERRFEILSPEGSFVLYSGTGDDRDEWCSEIRQAKAQLLSSLNVTHPHSTLTSSSSTNHLRRSLQALPFPLTDERMSPSSKVHKDEPDPSKSRRKVEHWVPAIWIPDEKTNECMRCGKSFGWRRRRHHCRLCGRCVCAPCSDRVGIALAFVMGEPLLTALNQQTFFITDSNAKSKSSKPARACDACYETVFPLVDSDPGAPLDVFGTIHRARESDSYPSISSLPSWLSMPSTPASTTPQALMAIDLEPLSSSPRRDSHQDFGEENHKRIRSRPLPTPRPRSYNMLLEDFEHNEHYRFDVLASPLEEEDDSGESRVQDRDHSHIDRQSSSLSSDGQGSLPSSPRKEDTARRHKRFSLPAVGLHTTSVTARTNAIFEAPIEDGALSSPKGNKRFSLVLGGGRSPVSRLRGSRSELSTKPDLMDSVFGHVGSKSELVGQSVAAGKLSEILSRKRD